MHLFKRGRKIDFIIAGTQKGGTTALDYYLRKHPDIGMGSNKELHFFDNESNFTESTTNYSKYDNCFNFEDNKTIYGEVTPIYMYWKPSCKRIWEYNPNIKLIFILRNPITRAFSNWNMEYDRGGDKESFSYAIKNETLRIKEALPLQHRVYSYIDRGHYSKQIKRFREYFNEKQLMFIKYEEFKNNQESVLNEIFRFLEVDPTNYSFEYQTIHKRKKHTEMSKEEINYLLNTFKNEIPKVEKMLNWDCSDWKNLDT